MLGDNWELNHVGLMITNRNATLRHFQSIGVGVSVGPQPLLPHEPGEGSLMYYRTLEGDPVTNTYRTGGAHTFNDGESQIGDCQLECYPNATRSRNVHKRVFGKTGLWHKPYLF